MRSFAAVVLAVVAAIAIGVGIEWSVGPGPTGTLDEAIATTLSTPALEVTVTDGTRTTSTGRYQAPDRYELTELLSKRSVTMIIVGDREWVTFGTGRARPVTIDLADTRRRSFEEDAPFAELAALPALWLAREAVRVDQRGSTFDFAVSIPPAPHDRLLGGSVTVASGRVVAATTASMVDGHLLVQRYSYRVEAPGRPIVLPTR